MVERIRKEEQLGVLQRQLEEANSRLETLATADGLTGLANRREFDTVLAEEWRRALRAEDQLSAIMIDVDCFKLYNDRYGHQAGDDCLQRVASVLSGGEFARRPGDLVARYGGEEFVVLLSGADPAYVQMVAPLICKHVAELAIPQEDSQVVDTKVVTISMGIATMTPGKGLPETELVKRADQALYQAKEEGRNRAITFA